MRPDLRLDVETVERLGRDDQARCIGQRFEPAQKPGGELAVPVACEPDLADCRTGLTQGEDAGRSRNLEVRLPDHANRGVPKVEVGPVLDGLRQSQRLGLTVQAADEADADRSAILAEAVGHHDTRMSRQIGEQQLVGATGRDDEHVEIRDRAAH